VLALVWVGVLVPVLAEVLELMWALELGVEKVRVWGQALARESLLELGLVLVTERVLVLV
jgi:hypothetical protein